jgi:hypothetical protein
MLRNNYILSLTNPLQKSISRLEHSARADPREVDWATAHLDAGLDNT